MNYLIILYSVCSRGERSRGHTHTDHSVNLNANMSRDFTCLLSLQIEAMRVGPRLFGRLGSPSTLSSA